MEFDDDVHVIGLRARLVGKLRRDHLLIGVLHRRAYRSDARQPWYTSAKFVNSAGILLPIAVLATLLPYGILASNNLQASRDDSASLYEVLERGAATWTPGSTVDPVQLHLTASLVYDVKHKMLRFQQTYEIFFAILAGWCGLLGITFVVVASLYLRDLKHSIQGMRVALAVNVSWIAATLRKILADGKTNAVAIIIPLFTVAALSIPVSIIVLHNAITTPSARAQSSSSGRSDSRHSTLGSKPPRSHEGASGVDHNLDQTYTTQFDLVAALPLDRFAFLSTGTGTGTGTGARGSGSGGLAAGESLDAIPFDSLELQPTPTHHSRGTKLDGIVVQRSEETVTVVALPKDGDVERELGPWNHFDEDEKKW
ncbi:hypothetical protein JCM11491_005737 [Sporobolomyces phaffii]